MKLSLENSIILSALAIYLVNLVYITDSQLVFAAQETYDCEFYQPRTSWDKYHGEAGPIRCLVDRGPGQNAWVTLENKSDVPVNLRYDEWHSRCGFDGGLTNSQEIRLEPGEKKDVTLQPPGTGVTCREAFIFQCLSTRSELGKCHDVVRVTWTTRD